MHKTLKLAVFGDPIAHSRSPQLHQYFASVSDLQVDYQRIHASGSELAPKLQHFLAEGGHGANITLPHKQAVMALCTNISARAKRAAAVNTLLRSGDGWRGDNTDGIGLVLDLQDQAIELDAASVLIIGAGGATRGIVPALLDAGCKRIVIANRRPVKAQALIAAINDTRLAASGLQRDYGATFDLLIHATAAGHQQRKLPLPEVLQGQPYCYDLSYADASRAFLDWAEQQGCHHSDGLGMLVAQAAESFRLWTGSSINGRQRHAAKKQLQAS